MTVLENITIRLAEENTYDESMRYQIALRLLAEVGLDSSIIHRYPAELSGGEQQRVALARALVHEPALLLADEPTGNLDSESSGVVLEALRRLQRSRGAALLLVTHSARIAAAADRVLRMRDGLLIEANAAVPLRDE